MSHTPGPWSYAWVAGALRHINRNVDTECFYDREYDESRDPTDPDWWPNHPERSEADYHLVTASPDLLAALEKLVAALENHDVLYGDEEVVEARAAIAKARGVK